MRKPLLLSVVLTLLSAAVLYLLSTRVGPAPPLGTLLDPVDGLYRTARRAHHPAEAAFVLPGLEQPVTVLRDARGVPHVFAASDRDAVMAFGYVVAQDRLFQMDFIPRAGTGRLAAVLGPTAVPADRFLRQTGIAWGARRNAARIRAEAGIEYDLASWFVEGVNAYIDGLEEEDLPFEFRLLGYRPERYSLLHVIGLLQYMTYDLTYQSDDTNHEVLRARLGPEAYAQLYPSQSTLYEPIIPAPEGGEAGAPAPLGEAVRRPLVGPASAPAQTPVASPLAMRTRLQQQLLNTVVEGFRHGKGSNNWAVSGARSTTGAPILAGDMHLSLTLPAIWYEVHLVTPTMNTYGVTVPGAPLPIEAFNEAVGWTFTNTGADQIDHYRLALDETGARYRYAGGWRDLEAVPDTIFVSGAAPVVDTLYYSHWGPVTRGAEGEAVAVRWVAHEPSRTLQALAGMNHARTLDDFEQALRFWDAPMQNVLYADVHGNIAIRSMGLMPLRRAGHGAGLLEGSDSAFAWTGRIPFDELPHATNPAQGYLTSTNQQPTDARYPYYLGYDWRDAYRSLRINALLRGKARHSVDDLKRYQADVHAVQRDLFVPLLDTLRSLEARADTLRRMLSRWDGTTAVDRPEPLVLDVFLQTLGAMTWDEPAFAGVQAPNESQLLRLLREVPESPWLDVQATAAREDAGALLRRALTATADVMARRYGWDPAAWRWGDHHKIVFRHITRSEALRPLWRGPVAYPGFRATLSPAADSLTTHSASWRVVVDFSQTPPQGYGVYPGGQSGNPFSPLYDLHLPSYLNFKYYTLHKPAAPEALAAAHVAARLLLRPTSAE